MGRLRLVDRGTLARYGAPAVFLLAATIAVLLVRDALHRSSGQVAPIASPPTSVVHRPRPTPQKTTPKQPAQPTEEHYYLVQRGDNFYEIRCAST